MKERDLGKEGNACRQTPGFWKPLLASEWSTWLAQLVKKIDMCQSRVCFILRGHDSHISFLWLLFTLVGKICLLMCKNIFFDHFQNVKHFLWLNKSNRGFRLFNLFSKVPPVSETLKAIFFFPQWFPAMFSHAGPSLLVSVFLRDVKFSQIVICRSKLWRMDGTLNWSYINYGKLHCDSVKIAL